MISAILYCLKYKYKFILYSKDANFATKYGWNDYFLPFCEETNLFLHSIFNKRISKPILSKNKKLLYKIYRYLNNNTYFTFDLWDNFYSKDFDNEFFDIPELNIKGDLRIASASIVEMIYKFNISTQKKIDIKIKEISLPDNFVSMQIRRGDKNTEWTFLPIEAYFETLTKKTISRNLFVLADDYLTICEIKKKYLKWNVFSLTEPQERGYIHSDFIRLSKMDKEKQIINLLSSIEIIRCSNLFVGTFTANTGLFIGMSMPFEKVISIQKKNWLQSSIDDVIQFVTPD